MEFMGSSQKHLSFGGWIRKTILKANGRAKEKRMCLKEQNNLSEQIALSLHGILC